MAIRDFLIGFQITGDEAPWQSVCSDNFLFCSASIIPLFHTVIPSAVSNRAERGESKSRDLLFLAANALNPRGPSLENPLHGTCFAVSSVGARRPRSCSSAGAT